MDVRFASIVGLGLIIPSENQIGRKFYTIDGVDPTISSFRTAYKRNNHRHGISNSFTQRFHYGLLLSRWFSFFLFFSLSATRKLSFLPCLANDLASPARDVGPINDAGPPNR